MKPKKRLENLQARIKAWEDFCQRDSQHGKGTKKPGSQSGRKWYIA